ncbi:MULTISPECIES: hypothetical protein [Providencia]|nr:MULTISPECIES: hypothetical protein [Providencia]WHT81569.1 hypothetical protein KOL65_20105 [Providencia rettgeri]WJM88186.1 hypothetical protein KOL64_20145 [Providencia rettgeri]
MHENLYCSKYVKTLNIINEETHECLVILVDTSLQAKISSEHLKV